VSQLLSQAFDAIGSVLALPIVRAGFQVLAAYVVVLWLGAAFWAFRDMRRRTTDVIAPYGSAALIVAFTPLFFPAAFLVHLVLRPPETLEERSEHALRRSILQAEAVGTTCATCASPVADDWLVCPVCANRLRRRCPSCERLVELTWDICAWCGRDFRPSLSVPDAAVATILANGSAPRRSEALAAVDRQPFIPTPAAQTPLGRLTTTARLAPTRAGGPHGRRRAAVPETPGSLSPAGSASLSGPVPGTDT
jgi:Double zinc ribbon